MEISIIGGDLRTVKLIKLLAQDKNKIKATFELEIPQWEDSLKVCVDELNK